MKIQLIYDQRKLTAATLGSLCPAPAVNGQMTGDFSQVGRQVMRSGGRDVVPCGQICIVYAFLCVFTTM